MHISYWNHWKNNRPDQCYLTYDQFNEEVIGTKHKIAIARHPAKVDPLWTPEKLQEKIDGETKKGTAAFSPTEYLPGAIRDKEQVISVSAFVGDWDKVSEEDMRKVVAFFDGVKCWFYTSYSHGKQEGKWSFRIVAPLDKPVPNTQWLDFWSRMQAALALEAVASDPSCSDSSRIYGLPYTSLDRADKARILYNKDGEVLKTDQVMQLPLPAIAIDAMAHVKVDKIDLKLLMRDVKKVTAGKSREQAQVAETTLLMLNGQAWTEVEGQRHDSTLPMTALLERLRPNASIEALTQLWHPACAVMVRVNPSYGDVEARLETIARVTEGARAHRLQVKAEKLAAREAARKEAYSAARGDGKDTAYDEEDLKSLAAFAGCEPHELGKRWMLFKGTAYYVLTLNGYAGPHTYTEAAYKARDLLPPSGLSIFNTNEKTGRQELLHISKLIELCGSVIDGAVISDMTIDRSYMDEEGNMHEACCKLRDIPAVYNAKVDQYIGLIGGKHAEKLRDWFAVSTNLSKPACALFIHGAMDSGKSLIPAILSSMWMGSMGASTLKSVLSDFNSALVQCPIVNADEKLPTTFASKVTSADLRDLISSRTRPLKRKGIAETGMKGCIRLVIGANNINMLAFPGEVLEEDDRKAVSERFLVLKTDSSIADWFTANGLDQATIERDWINGQAFAQHIMWLKETRVVVPGKKLLVHGDAKAVNAMLVTAGPLQGAICQWLVDVVQDLKPGKGFSAEIRRYMALDSRGLWVASNAVVDACMDGGAIRTQKVVGAAEAGRGLGSLSVQKEKRDLPKQPGAQRQQATFHLISVDNLKLWMDDASWGDINAINEVLANHEKYQSASLTEIRN